MERAGLCVACVAVALWERALATATPLRLTPSMVLRLDWRHDGSVASSTDISASRPAPGRSGWHELGLSNDMLQAPTQ